MSVDAILQKQFDRILQDASWLKGGDAPKQIVSDALPKSHGKSYANILFLGGIAAFSLGCIGLVVSYHRSNKRDSDQVEFGLFNESTRRIPGRV